MAFCSNCGTEANGAFCPNCGTSLGANPAGASAAGNASGYVPPAATGAAAMSGNLVAALCYLLGIIGGIIFLLLDPYNKDRTIRFHAFQSIFLFVAWVVFGIVLGILTHGLALLLYPIYQLFFLVVWIYMIVSAYQGKKVMLPVIGDLAQKQA